MRRVPGGKYWVLAAAGILAGYGLGSNGLMPDVDITVRLPAVEAGLYQPSGRLPDGEEPQVIVLERTLDRDDAVTRYVTDRVLTRASGLLEIEDLVKQGDFTEQRR